LKKPKNGWQLIVKTMKFLITGGAGFIASYLIKELAGKSQEIVVIDKMPVKQDLSQAVVFHKADILDFNAIKPIFNDIDYVFHLAGTSRISDSLKDPVGSAKLDILGAINVFKASALAKRVVYISSSAVYGKQDLPFKETMNPDPVNLYGAHKLIAEKLAGLFPVPVVSLRCFNVYGPDTDSRLVIGDFLKQKKQGKPLAIFGTGEQIRDFCHVEDAARAFLKASQSSRIKGGEVINIGSGKAYSVKEIAEMISSNINYLPQRPIDVIHSQADISLAKELLDWEPEISLEQGINNALISQT